MFNLFKKKEPRIVVSDKIVMSEEAKFNALFNEWNKDKSACFIFWFEESFDKAASYFSARTTETVNLLMAREAMNGRRHEAHLFYGEHYPLLSKEQQLFQQMSPGIAYVFSSLDEPLFQLFGGVRIINLMKSLGLKEDEVVEHKMISNSIRNAQEKIEKKVVIDQSATSQADWMKKNINH